MAGDFYHQEYAQDVPFEMSGLYARPGWYVRIHDTGTVLGPFDDRASALDEAQKRSYAQSVGG